MTVLSCRTILGTFSITFFMGNCKPQTAKCHVTTALRSCLQFAVHVWTAGTAPSGKWFTASFFATKNCTASRLKVWTSFLYRFAMCLLDFWSRINDLLPFFGRLKWCTSTRWKQHAALNNERVVQIDYIFLSAVLTKESILSQSNFFSILLLNSWLNSVFV